MIKSIPASETGIFSPVQNSLSATDNDWSYVFDRLNVYRGYQDDWDGEGSPAPGPEIVDAAIAYARSLRDKGEQAPDMVVPGVNGTIALEWHTPKIYREIEFERADAATICVINRETSQIESTTISLR
jgi:hypothetical protein